MSRSGYSYDCENLELYRQTVSNAINGKRGQAFLKELAQAMDAMPVKRLISNELISENGEMCAIGTVCQTRGLDVSEVDIYDSEAVGNLIGIARSMAAEIEFQNDEGSQDAETSEQRYIRMRDWVSRHLKESK